MPRVGFELARLDLQPRRNAAIRLGAQTFLAWLEVARGRWDSAEVAFDAAERHGVPGDYVAGANIAGFERVAAAMLAQRPLIQVPFAGRQFERTDRVVIRFGVFGSSASDAMVTATLLSRRGAKLATMARVTGLP